MSDRWTSGLVRVPVRRTQSTSTSFFYIYSYCVCCKYHCTIEPSSSDVSDYRSIKTSSGNVLRGSQTLWGKMSQPPQGEKRRIAMVAGDLENISPDSLIRPRQPKTPKLNSLQLDRLYKNFRKENNCDSKKQVRPNLNATRRHGPPPSSAVLQQMADKSQTNTASSSGWEQPKKTLKISSKPAEVQNSPKESNRFQVLSEDHEMDSEDIEQSTALRDNNATTKKDQRQPPIYTINTNINLLVNAITAINIPKSEFLIKEVSPENQIIYTHSEEHYKAMANLLLENKMQYYTYTPKNLKLKSIVLKGVRGNFSIEEIKQEILDRNIPELEINNLTKFVYDKARPENFHYLLQLSHNSITKDLFTIKSIAYQRVRWEHLKKPSIFQCRKCQRLGHASKNCHLQYTCVKCANNHEIGKCPIQKEDNRSQLKCANCDQVGHPASYKGCPYIKFALEQKKMAKIVKVQSALRKITNISASVRGETLTDTGGLTAITLASVSCTDLQIYQ